jgi:deoxyribodipyrimidine photo-lyase
MAAQISGNKRSRASDGDGGVPPIDAARVRSLNEVKGKATDGPVLLVLDRDQRLEDNWAALHARRAAHEAGVPLIVAFVASPAPGSTLRAWGFIVSGLAEVERSCDAKSIPLVVLHGPPAFAVPAFVAQENVSLVVFDFSPLRADRAWRSAAAARLGQLGPAIPCVEVDAHNAVPVWAASDRIEYAARTIRPRIMSKLERFLVDFWAVAPQDVPW